MSFKQRYGAWALIAGGSTGLGGEYAAQAASRGLNLLIVGRRAELLEATAKQLRDRYPVEVRTLAADLSSPAIRTVIGAAVAGLEIGLFIYNAAAEPQGRFLDTVPEEHAFNIAMNCTTPTMLVYDLAPPMVKRGRGGIVLVSSMASLVGMKMFVHYGAGKAYELILGEGLWDEMRDHGVDAFSWVVGSTETPNWLANTGIAPQFAPLMKPRTPLSVAQALFAVLDREGKDVGPRHYSHPDDEAMAYADAKRTRAEFVAAAGKSTSSVFVGPAGRPTDPTFGTRS